MVRNLAGLKRSAQSRSDGTMSRATLAIRQMKSEEVEINFRSVAARASVSTAWLYRTKPLRDKIMKARTACRLSPARLRSIVSGSRMNGSWQLCDCALRRLEERNRELTDQLEAAYGRLVVVQSKLGSLNQANIATLGKRDR